MSILFHVTSTENLPGIRSEGLRDCSYWSDDPRIAAYYAETVRDEGRRPQMLRLPLAVLERFHPEPDYPGLEEPLTHTLGRTEAEVWEDWEREPDPSWQACLALIGTIRAASPIPFDVLLEHNPEIRAETRPKPSHPRV